MTDDVESQTPPPNAVESCPRRRYWRFDEVLGRGAFKTVFKSFDSREGTEVAWNKVQLSLAANECRLKKRLFSEIHVLKRLKHKNIMTFHDYWLDDRTNTLNFITELFTHGSLKKFRAKHKHLELKVLKKWAWQILQGLVYLHGHEPPIIHRDLKCDNVLINGVTGDLKIGDLGLATLWKEGHGPQSIGGTPEFMAPEFYDEEYNEKVDVYAFGMLLLELVSMDYPYSECSNTLAIYKKVCQGVFPASIQKIKNDDLRKFIELCIAYSPSERPEARKLLKNPFFDEIRKTMEPDRQLSEDIDHELLGRLSEASCSERSCQMSLSRQTSKSVHSSVEMEGEEAVSHAESTSNGVKIRIECSKVEDEPKLNFTLTYDPPGGPQKCIRFPFDIIYDTAQQIVDEMRAESIDTDLMINEEEATTIGQLIAMEVEKWRVKDEGEMVSYVNVMRQQPESPRHLMPVNSFAAREVLESKMDDICQTVAYDLTEGSVFRTLVQGNRELIDYYQDNSARSQQRLEFEEFESDGVLTDDSILLTREGTPARSSMDEETDANAIDIPRKRRLSTCSTLEPSNSISSTVSDSRLHFHERRGPAISRSIIRRLSSRQHHSEGPASGLRTSVLRTMSMTVDGGSNPTESPLKSASPQCQPMEMRLVVAQPTPETDALITKQEGTLDNEQDLRSTNRSLISMLTMKPSKKSWEGCMPTVPETSVSSPGNIRPNPLAISKADEWQWSLANGPIFKESESLTNASNTTGVSPQNSFRHMDSSGSIVDHGIKSSLPDIDSCSKSDANQSLASRSRVVDGMGMASRSSSVEIGRSMEEMHELDLNDQDQALKGVTEAMSLTPMHVDQLPNDQHQAGPRPLTADALDLHMACMSHPQRCKSTIDFGSSWKSESIRAFRREEPPLSFAHRSQQSWTDNQMTIEAKQRVNRMFNSCVEMTGFMDEPVQKQLAGGLNRTVHGSLTEAQLMDLTDPQALLTMQTDTHSKGQEMRSKVGGSLTHRGSGSMTWTDIGQDPIAIDVQKQQTEHNKELRRLKADEDILKMQQQQLAGLCSGAALGVARGKAGSKSYRPAMNGSLKSLI